MRPIFTIITEFQKGQKLQPYKTFWILLFLLLSGWMAAAQPPISEGDCGRTVLAFDGNDDYATVSVPDFSYASGTVEAWVRKDNWINQVDDALFSNGLGHTANNSFYFSFHPSVGLHFRYGGFPQSGNTAAFLDISTTNNLSTDEWYHFAATWHNNGSNTVLTTYRDGVQVATATTSTNLVLNGPTNFGIAQGASGSHSVLQNGRVADFRIWNVARTQTEIANNKDNRLNGDETNLIAYWPLDDQPNSAIATNLVADGSAASLQNMNTVNAWQSYPLTISAGDLINSGASYNFGTGIAGYVSDPVVFTIKNEGTAAIDLTGEPVLEITGTHADQFTLDQSGMAASLAAGATTTFTVSFSPGSRGMKEALVSFSSKLNCENAYQVNLTGEAYDAGLSYGGEGFVEANANDGSVAGSIVITLTGDTFADQDENNLLDPGTQFTLPNLPAGLTPVLTLSSSTQAVLTLTGQADNHQATHNLSNINFVFNNAAFTSNTANQVINASAGSGKGIAFDNNPVLSFSGSGFSETNANDGSVSGSIFVAVSYDSFSSDLAIGNGVGVGNIPAGLTPVLNKSLGNSREFSIVLEGKAENHQVSNSINDITFTFTDVAFVNSPVAAVFNASGTVSSGRGISFLDNTGELTYSGPGFTEVEANNGAVDGSLTMTLTGVETFSDPDMDGQLTIGDQITFENLPAGLTPIVSLNSTQEAVLTLIGNAISHQENNQVSDILLSFEDAAFEGGSRVAVTNSHGPVSTEVGIIFSDNPSLTYRGDGFYENEANDGSIAGSIIVELVGDTFEDTDANDALEIGNQVIISNIPTGIIPLMTLVSSTQAELTLSGKAENHQAYDDVDEITLEFTNAAFNLSEANNVLRSAGFTTSVKYLDNLQVIYSGDGFNENLENDGSVTGNINITLRGDKFKGTGGELTVGSQVTLGNIPDGLTPSVTIVKNKKAGVDWLAQSGADNYAEWRSVTYGKGLFVAVASSGSKRVMTSPDGIIWTARQAAENNNWRSVTYGNGLFVAVASSGNNKIMTSPDGINWTGISQDEYSSWRSITYGNGRFVAVADNGDDQVMTSADGVIWTGRAAAEDNSWQSVTYGNGLFVAVASNGDNQIMTSPDGITWTGRAAAESNNWRSVTYGNGLFVAVASNGDKKIMTSPDGITWAGIAQEEDHEWQSITYGNGLFVAVAENGDRLVMTSSDGENWTTGVAAEENYWYGVGYGKGKFVAVGSYNYGDNVVMTSATDVLATLTLQGNADNHTATENEDDITFDFSDEAFFSVEAIDVFNATGPASSGLGIKFGSATLAYTGGFEESELNDGSVSGSIIITLNGDTFNDSDENGLLEESQISMGIIPDGLTPVFTINSLTEVEVTLTGNATSHQKIHDVADIIFDFDDSAFENFPAEVISNAVQQSTGIGIKFRNNPIISYSGEGFVETTANNGSVTGSILLTLTGDKFNDVNNNGLLEIGTEVTLGNLPDGLTPSLEINSNVIAGVDWFRPELPLDEFGESQYIYLKSVTYGNGLFVAVADYGDYHVMTSPDGISWTYRDAPSENWQSIAYGNGRFVVVAENYIMTSADGITWTRNSSSIPDGEWTSVTFGNGIFVAVSSYGDYSVMISSDGLSWSPVPAPNESDWSSITYGNGLFVAVADYANDNYRVMSSPDGITWTASVLPENSAWNSVTYGDGKFVAVARSGTKPVVTSIDGENWESHEAPITSGLASVAYGDGVYVAVTNYGYNEVMTSIDGSTWEAQSLNGRWESVIYGDGQFVAVGSGQNAVLTSKTDVSATLHLSGAATNNQAVHNVSDITFNFDNTAFLYNEATKVINATGPASSGLGIEFINNTGTISYAGPGFTENAENLGAVEGGISFTLTGGETFVDLDESGTLAIGSQVVLQNVPSGLVAEIMLNSTTEAQLTFSGNANEHQPLHDVQEIFISFNNDAFENGDVTLVGNAVGPISTGYGIIFNANPVLTYEGEGFLESEANDGSVTGSITLNLFGDQFHDNDEDGEIVVTSQVTIGNLPDGLTPTLSITESKSFGIDWTSRSALDNNDVWESVAFGEGLFVAVGSGGDHYVMTSPDGINWTARQAVSGDWETITYGNGIFVALSSIGDNQSMTSTDGINWTSRQVPSMDWRSVTYGNGLFVAVAGSGDNRVMTSPDGINWTLRAATNNNYWTSISYGNGLFVAVSSSGEDENKIMTSSDGINWAARNESSGSRWQSVTYGNGLFVSISNSSAGKIMTSPDGIDWTTQELNIDNPGFSGITYGNGLFIAISRGGRDDLLISADGTNWTNETPAEINDWNSIIFGKNRCVAVGGRYSGSNTVMTSENESTAELTLTGNATENQVSSNVDDITFTFADIAFSSSQAAEVFNATGPASSGLGITFTDNPTISYSGDGFYESEANNGIIDGSIIITLEGDTFTESLSFGTELSVQQIPVGLTAVITRDSDTQATLTLAGKADLHQQENDVADITFDFTDDAFSTSSATAVLNATGPASSGRGIVFNDNPANDFCSAPQQLTVYVPGDGTPTEGSTAEAEVLSDFNICSNPFGFSPEVEQPDYQDVWYSFNSGETGQVIITTELETASSVSGAIYSSCGEIYSFSDPNSESSLPACANDVREPILLILPSNTDFLLQVWNTTQSAGTFSILLESNAPPVIEPIEDISMDEETELEFTVNASDDFILPNSNSSEPEDAELEYFFFGENIDMAYYDDLGMTLDSSTGEFRWTPTEAQNGEYEVTIAVTDYVGFSVALSSFSTVTFTIMVNEVNLPPVIASIENISLQAGEKIEEFSITASDPDIPVQELEFSLDQASLEAEISIGASSGVLSWEPQVSDYGTTRTVEVSVTDGVVATTAYFDISVGKADQEIVFNTIEEKTYGDADFTLSASGGSSNNPVTFTSNNSSVAIITNGNNVSIVGAGTATITANQAGNDNFAPAAPVEQLLTVAKSNITVTADALSKTYGDDDPELTYEITAGTLASGDTFTGALERVEGENVGSYAINQGNLSLDEDNYNLTFESADFTITPRAINVFALAQSKTYGEEDPELTFSTGESLLIEGNNFDGALIRDEGDNVATYAIRQGNLTLGDNYTINFVEGEFTINKATLIATADDKSRAFGEENPELTISYSGFAFEEDANVLTSEPTFSTTANAESPVGDYTITLTGGEAANYDLSLVEGRLTITPASQMIVFDALQSKYLGEAPFTLSATGGESGNPITFFSSDESVATISENTVTIVGVGTTTITASQAGNDNYRAAEEVSVSFEVLAPSTTPQTITFDPIPNKVFGDQPIDLLATASSGLPVVFEVEGPASLSGNRLTITGAGDITVTALQAGDFNFTNAVATQSFSVAKRDQLITLPEIQDKLVSDAPFSIDASVNSGLVMSYDISGPASISSEGIITLDGASGLVLVTVSQPGDDNHNAAEPVTISFLVSDPNKTDQSIDFPTIADRVLGQPPFALAASASSGLTVSYEVVSGPATITEGTVTIVGAGTVSIRAQQNGNGEFNPANPVSRTFTIAKASQTVSFTEVPDKVYGDEPFALIATSSQGLPVDFSILTGPARLSGNNLTLTGAGEVTVQAIQVGNANYNPAQIIRTFTVAKAPLKITADAISRPYGEANPELTLSYEGFVGNDDASDIVPPVATTAADATSPVIDAGYPVTLSGGSAENYELTLVDGILTVEKAELIATADDVQRAFGEDNPVFTISYEGFVNGDSESDIAAPVATTSATATSANGIYDIILAGGSAQNYAFVLVPGTLTVGKARLIARADRITKPYGATLPALTISYEGFTNGDTEADIVPPTAATAVEAGTAPGIYAISLTGGVADNYELVLEDGELEVTKAPLTVKADDKQVSFGEALPALTLTYSGFVNAESQAILDALPTASTVAFQGSNAGEYTIAVAGGASTLYDFIYTEGILTISKLQASITVSNLEQVLSEEGNLPEITTDPAGLDYIITFDGSTDIPTTSGEYEVVVTIDDPNYEGAVSGTLVIDEAVTAIEEVRVEVAMYPNPVQDALTIEVTHQTLGRVELFSLQGVLIRDDRVTSNMVTMDVKSILPGVYMLRLWDTSGHLIGQRKLLKQ